MCALCTHMCAYCLKSIVYYINRSIKEYKWMQWRLREGLCNCHSPSNIGEHFWTCRRWSIWNASEYINARHYLSICKSYRLPFVQWPPAFAAVIPKTIPIPEPMPSLPPPPAAPLLLIWFRASSFAEYRQPIVSGDGGTSGKKCCDKKPFLLLLSVCAM